MTKHQQFSKEKLRYKPFYLTGVFNIMQPILLALFICFAINMIAFLIAFSKQTDHLTDATYSFTFCVLAIFFFVKGSYTIPRILLMLMVCMWAIRLGSYLYSRIRQMGVDTRFDEMRPHWNRFIKFWMLQAGSIWIIALPFIIGLSNAPDDSSLSMIQYIGFGIWIIGFLMETIADLQKSKFKKDPANKNMFMGQGLYSIIKYPNYLGEMLVWIGIFLYVCPWLTGWAWISIVSPLWIIVLLLWISGIPFLKKSSQAKYGHLPSYQAYAKKTKNLIPYIY